MVGNAKRHPIVFQKAHDLIMVPTGMAEFERIAPAAWQHLQKSFQPRFIGDKAGRQLEQNQAALWPQPVKPHLHQYDGVFTFGGELPAISKATWPGECPAMSIGDQQRELAQGLA